MRILLSSIGSRGDVQPLLALALELRTLGHEAKLCVPPNFKHWIESFGVSCVPIGPDLENITPAPEPVTATKPSPELLRQLAAATVRELLEVTLDAARDCDAIVAAGIVQFATRSIAEAARIPYIFVAYAPITLPSAHHPPPPWDHHYRSFRAPSIINRYWWKKMQRRMNDQFLDPVNLERARLGLKRIADITSHMVTERPWIAADTTLAPAPPIAGASALQTGAWLLPDSSPLSEELETFLGNGRPPVYFGLGSTAESRYTGRMLIDAARSLGMRSILSKGWAHLGLGDGQPDCITIGDTNHEALFPRVAAVVHHGGAGTTTAAARAGVPQVLIPHIYDQFYWAQRIQTLNIGVCTPMMNSPRPATLTRALRSCLESNRPAAARAIAHRIEHDGARTAASLLVCELTKH